MSGILYVVGTPIGNLGDMTPRAIQTLGKVDFIAAEDTRVTQKLLSHFDIHTPMISYYQHNLRERGQEIIARLLAGESCAVVTDAGMPCISDPGEDLVSLCVQGGIETAVVPGPSALISALAVSGLVTSRFSFEGFLSTNGKNRRQHLDEIKNQTQTLIFYEAPHKLRQTLADLFAALGDRKISICRELTKLHEEVIRTTLADAGALYAEKAPRGEFVLIVEGAAKTAKPAASIEDALDLTYRYANDGLKLTDAAKKAANETGRQKSELYRLAVQKGKTKPGDL